MLGKGQHLGSLVYDVFVTFLCGVLGQVRHLIVSISDLCPLTYFALFHQLDLVLQLNYVSDSFTFIFSQPKVNNLIDTKIHPINYLHISNQTK